MPVCAGVGSSDRLQMSPCSLGMVISAGSGVAARLILPADTAALMTVTTCWEVRGLHSACTQWRASQTVGVRLESLPEILEPLMVSNTELSKRGDLTW